MTLDDDWDDYIGIFSIELPPYSISRSSVRDCGEDWSNSIVLFIIFHRSTKVIPFSPCCGACLILIPGVEHGSRARRKTIEIPGGRTLCPALLHD